MGEMRFYTLLLVTATAELAVPLKPNDCVQRETISSKASGQYMLNAATGAKGTYSIALHFAEKITDDACLDGNKTETTSTTVDTTAAMTTIMTTPASTVTEMTGSTDFPTTAAIMTTTPHNEATGAAEFAGIVKFWMELLIYLINYIF